MHGAVSLGVKLASATAAICTVIGFAYDWGVTGGSATRRSVGTFGATWVGLTPAVDTMKAIGDTLHMAATVTDKRGTAIVGLETKWSVDHPEVAAVNPDGTVIAESPGSATILVTLGTLNARAAIIVRPVSAVVHVASDSAVTIPEGTAHAVSARSTDVRGHVLAGRAIHWHSADTTVVGIDSTGNLVGIGAGHTTVTATIDGVSADAPVTVSPVAGALAVVEGDKQHAAAGASLPQPVVVLLVSRRGRPLAGQTVHLRRIDATASGDFGAVTTDANGKARVAWRLTDVPGRQRLEATVDGVDSAVCRWGVWGGARRERSADSGHGFSDFAGDLLIKGHQLGGTLADIGCEGLCLDLPGSALHGRAAAGTISDRKAFAHIESCSAGVFDRVSDP